MRCGVWRFSPFEDALYLNMSKKGANGNLEEKKVCRQIKSAPLGFHQAEHLGQHAMRYTLYRGLAAVTA